MKATIKVKLGALIALTLLVMYVIYGVQTMKKAEQGSSNMKSLPSIEERMPKIEKRTYYDIPLDKDIQDYANAKCKESNLDVELVLAVIKVESDFQSDLISVTNDYGLMQINSCNHESLKTELGIYDFLNPYQSIDAGVYMLSGLKNSYENENMMLMAYNMGSSGARKRWNQGIYQSNYTNKVLQAKQIIRSAKYEEIKMV